MAVNSNYSINSYIANGILTDFSFDFEVLSISNLVVNVKDTDGNVSLQVLGVDYTATINSDGTGQISFAVAPANNYVVYIARNIPETQENNFETSSGFQAELIEKSLDKLTMITQQLSEVNNRIIEISQFADVDAKGEIKEIVDNKCLVWKDNGDGSLSIYASENNPDTIYNDIVNNPNVIAVSSNIDNINTVANNSTNIDAVAGNSTNINSVASNIANVNSVGANISNVNSVASNSSNINSVAGDLTNINNVAGDLTNINNVASDLSNVDIVANNINNVNTNATNISSINTNATNISNINIVANNIATIQEKANIDGSNVDENFFTGANFTADTIDYIVETGSNAYGFYKKYKSGKTIQGANSINGGTLGAGQGNQVVITLPTPTQSTNYIVNVNLDDSFTHYASIGYAVINKTTTGFVIDQYNIANGTSGTIYYNYSLIEF